MPEPIKGKQLKGGVGSWPYQQTLGKPEKPSSLSCPFVNYEGKYKKRTSLLRQSLNYCYKKFYKIGPEAHFKETSAPH